MSRRTMQDAFRLIFSPEAILPFLLGSLALGVMGNAVFTLLTNWLGSSTPALLSIVLGTVLVLIGAAFFLERVLRRLPGRLKLDKKAPEARRGLILLVSNKEACQTAITYHGPRLDHCWLLHSTITTELANEVCQDLEGQGKHGHLRHVEDVFDPTVCAKVVEDIYANLPAPLTPADVILDFTGMTALASIGGVLAAVGWQAPLEYTPAQRDSSNRVMGSLPPFEVVLTPTLLGRPGATPRPTPSASASTREHDRQL